MGTDNIIRDELYSRLSAIQIGALLCEVLACNEMIYSENWDYPDRDLLAASIERHCRGIAAAVERIAAVVTDHVFDSREAGEAYDEAIKQVDKLLE